MRGSFYSTLAAVTLSAASAGPPANEAPDDSLRVALLTPGPVSDQAWNGEAYRGLVAVKDSLGAAISHIQTRTPAPFDENFREYGRLGYDLVMGHGLEVRDRAPLPGFFALGAKPGVVRFVVNPALTSRITGHAQQRTDVTWATMAEGRWQLPVSR